MPRCRPECALLPLVVLAACSPRAAEPLVDDPFRFPEYVDPPLPRDTLAPVRDLLPLDTIPPRVPPEQAHITAGVEILPRTPPMLHAGASVRDSQGRLASAGIFCLLGLRMLRPTDSRLVWISVGRGEVCASARHPGVVTSGGFPADPRNPQRFRMADIPGDSVSPGRYHFLTSFSVARPGREHEWVVLDAGAARIK